MGGSDSPKVCVKFIYLLLTYCYDAHLGLHILSILHNILSNNVAIIGLPTFVLITGMICSVLTWSYNVDVPAERSILKFQHHYGTKVPGLQP